MKKILIVILTLGCFITSSAQSEDKATMIQTINQAIINGDSAQYQLLDNFIAQYGMTSDALTLQALQLERQDNIPEATAKLENAISTHTGNDIIDLSTMYCFLMTYSDDPGSKLTYAELSLKDNPKNIQAYYKRAKVYFYLEKYKEAVKDLKTALKISKGAPDIRVELARAYLLMDDDKKGLKELDIIIKDYPNHPEARNLRAQVHFYNGNIERFVDDHLYYLQLTNDLNMRYVNAVADTAYDYILDYADQILEHVLDPEDVAYWNYFEANLKMITEHDTEGAMKQLETALSLTKDSDEFRGKILALQIVYYGPGYDNEKKLEIIEEIEKITRRKNLLPADWVLSRKQTILCDMKRYEEAKTCISQLIGNNRQGETTDSLRLAYYYFQRCELNNRKFNNQQGALNDIDSALMYMPDMAAYRFKRAAICRKHFNYGYYVKLIQEDCNKILAVDTVTMMDSYRHLAYALLGQKAEAEAWLNKLIEEFGGEKYVRGLIDYNGACAYSLLNDSYNATRLLMDALECDSLTCEQMNDDSDFDNIRETPEFKSILKITCSDQKE